MSVGRAQAVRSSPPTRSFARVARSHAEWHSPFLASNSRIGPAREPLATISRVWVSARHANENPQNAYQALDSDDQLAWELLTSVSRHVAPWPVIRPDGDRAHRGGAHFSELHVGDAGGGCPAHCNRRGSAVYVCVREFADSRGVDSPGFPPQRRAHRRGQPLPPGDTGIRRAPHLLQALESSGSIDPSMPY